MSSAYLIIVPGGGEQCGGGGRISARGGAGSGGVYEGRLALLRAHLPRGQGRLPTCLPHHANPLPLQPPLARLFFSRGRLQRPGSLLRRVDSAALLQPS